MSYDSKSSYYDIGGLETFAIIRAKLTPEQFKGFLIGSALKYICRMQYKGDEERDAEKARNYVNLLEVFIQDEKLKRVEKEKGRNS